MPLSPTEAGDEDKRELLNLIGDGYTSAKQAEEKASLREGFFQTRAENIAFSRQFCAHPIALPAQLPLNLSAAIASICSMAQYGNTSHSSQKVLIPIIQHDSTLNS